MAVGSKPNREHTHHSHDDTVTNTHTHTHTHAHTQSTVEEREVRKLLSKKPSAGPVTYRVPKPPIPTGQVAPRGLGP